MQGKKKKHSICWGQGSTKDFLPDILCINLLTAERLQLNQNNDTTHQCSCRKQHTVWLSRGQLDQEETDHRYPEMKSSNHHRRDPKGKAASPLVSVGCHG